MSPDDPPTPEEVERAFEVLRRHYAAQRERGSQQPVVQNVRKPIEASRRRSTSRAAT